MSEESLTTSESVSFKLDTHYSFDKGEYYNPEDYYLIKSISESISIFFDEFINEFQEYSYLRSIDLRKVKINDRIFIESLSCTAIIIKIDDDKVEISVNGEQSIVEISDIRPVDEYINRLKMADIKKIYNYIRDKINRNMFSNIEYFCLFSEYFRINEKILYQSIDIEAQTKLLDELDKKTNCLKKRNIIRLW